jgi:mannose/cellobiose epimerase-like protein (N-acyl-D-glucosamine 2-epimerase family)
MWRSVVTTARHLWAYSAASRFLKNPAWLSGADYAFSFLTRSHLDPQFGGA